MPGSWWVQTTGPALAQGDLLAQCYVPLLPSDFDGPTQDPVNMPLARINLIVLTQSCDLDNAKTDWVVLCRYYELQEWERLYPQFAAKREPARKGQIEGLMLLAGCQELPTPTDCIVIDFKQVFSLPHKYLRSHAERFGERLRLQSPYTEHFSQGFARFFMRVGLPEPIPQFTKK